MPTPPTYTNAFRVVGSAAEVAPISGGEPSWGYFRSAPIGAYNAVDYASGTSSYDYIDTIYPGITAMTDTLYRTWSPFQLQFLFNDPFGSNPTGFVVRGWIFGDPDDYDRPFVDEVDFSDGVVGATATTASGTFVVDIESGNHNGVPQDTLTLSGPVTAITLP